MTVFLFPNIRKDPGLAVTHQAARLLLQKGAKVILRSDCRGVAVLPGVAYAEDAKAFEQADLVLTVGGDGTILHAARGCLAHSLPILGVNVGRVGFLASCEVNELDSKISRLLAQDYCYDERRLLRADTNGSVSWSANALNDIVLYSGNRLQTMDFCIYCDDILVSQYSSDGVIIATPTGSTAYSLSAGGPILDAHIAGFVVNAICAHSLKNPPIVFSADRRITISVSPRQDDPVFISCDGSDQQQLAPESTVDICLSQQKLKLISFAAAEQFAAIDKKLMGRW